MEKRDIIVALFSGVIGAAIILALSIFYQERTSQPSLTMPIEFKIKAGNNYISIPIRNDAPYRSATGLRIEGMIGGNWTTIIEKELLPAQSTWDAQINLTEKITPAGGVEFTVSVPINVTYFTNMSCYDILSSEKLLQPKPNFDLQFKVICENCLQPSQLVYVRNNVEEISGFTNTTKCKLQICDGTNCTKTNFIGIIQSYAASRYKFLSLPAQNLNEN